jgi:hypothetical protein
MADSPSIVRPLDGKTSIDDKMFFEPERLSYSATVQLAAKIRQAIGTIVGGKDVIIANTALFVDLWNLKTAMASLHSFEIQYRGLVAAPVKEQRSAMADADVAEALTMAGAAAGLASVAPAIAGAMGVLSLFREDVEYRGIRTVVDPLALELALANELKHEGNAANVFVVDLFAPPSGTSALLKQLESVYRAKFAAWQTVGPQVANMARLDVELDRAARAGDQKLVDDLALRIASVRKDLEPFTEPLSQLDRRLSELEATLNRTDEKTALSAIARLIRAESICAEAPGACFVHSAVVSSGGHHRISRSLLRTIFTGDGLSFTGGAVVRWAVIGTSGAIEIAGVENLRLKGAF